MAVTDSRIKSKAGMMPPYRVMLMPDAFCSSARFFKSTMTAAGFNRRRAATVNVEDTSAVNSTVVAMRRVNGVAGEAFTDCPNPGRSPTSLGITTFAPGISPI